MRLTGNGTLGWLLMKLFILIGSFADTLSENANVLVHGDVSPKNILIRNDAPVLLDAECATMGEARFDPVFCLDHLILKAIHVST